VQLPRCTIAIGKNRLESQAKNRQQGLAVTLWRRMHRRRQDAGDGFFQARDTFPRLLLQHAQVRGDKPAMREKDLGIWQSWTWHDVAEEVRAIACGLAEMGFRRGENLAIVGENRPRMYMMMTAAQCLGGVPLPLYQDAVASEMLFVLLDAEVRFVFVEDQEQVDKVLEIQAEVAAARTSALRRSAWHAPLHVAVHPRHPRVDGHGADT
jgi:long-subunit acyl-CoA synthetase (AMP-forming)